MTMNIAEVAAGIAANIRRDGHFQDNGTCGEDSGVCIVINPGWDYMEFEFYEDGHTDYIRRPDYKKNASRLMDAIGIPDGPFSERTTALYKWNDTTPTEQVLAKLDEIAAQR